ncbi:AraC family transcriptional regulator [Sulfurimonas sp.]|uniref:AraC family transcriptional regulator n=1 Tax=Sulfurimonas sp. TaxID=2022749 RepID=UPI003D0A51C4
MKKDTMQIHSQIANSVMYYIYQHIATNINVDELAKMHSLSKFHFHRIFKEQIGMNIYETIKSIRLQKAANLLLTNTHSTITEIANQCGYSSQTSFIRAFKERFEVSPKVWRKGGFKNYSNQILQSSPTASLSLADYSLLEPKIIKTEDQVAYYVRHKGYNYEIKKSWQKLQAWVYGNNITEYKEIGIYHDNPIVTPLKECYYIAATVPLSKTKLQKSVLSSFTIPAGLYATFEVKGKYGDILKLIQWAYHEWLPKSGFETTTQPSYTEFYTNHFLSDKGEFHVKYFLPIQLI